MCRNGGSLALSSILLKFFPVPNTSMHGLVLASSQPLWPLDFRVLSQRKLVGRVKTVLYDQASSSLLSYTTCGPVSKTIAPHQKVPTDIIQYSGITVAASLPLHAAWEGTVHRGSFSHTVMLM